MTMIPFTQYLLPDGKKRLIWINVSAGVGMKAAELIKSKGCHFDAEVLTTGEVSFTCEKDDDLVSIQICSNNSQVAEAVKRLIEDASDKLLLKERERNQ